MNSHAWALACLSSIVPYGNRVISRGAVVLPFLKELARRIHWRSPTANDTLLEKAS